MDKIIQKVLTVGVSIDVLIKRFAEEKLLDDKKLSKIEEDMLLLKEVNIQYNISIMEVTLSDYQFTFTQDIQKK